MGSSFRFASTTRKLPKQVRDLRSKPRTRRTAPPRCLRHRRATKSTMRNAHGGLRMFNAPSFGGSQLLVGALWDDPSASPIKAPATRFGVSLATSPGALPRTPAPRIRRRQPLRPRSSSWDASTRTPMSERSACQRTLLAPYSRPTRRLRAEQQAGQSLLPRSPHPQHHARRWRPPGRPSCDA
ncbi:MAG: hypothetical protein ACI9KE_001386 [Polyangiales bacterium]|jgi:hypothetical protein